MKRNGMCPICYLKQFFVRSGNITDIYLNKRYINNVATTPPMGWSSWNTFRNRVNQDMLLEIADSIRDSGLLEAGYRYLNVDDNWISSQRDDQGVLQGDLTTFSMGMPEFIKQINSRGLKVGLYTSNGTLTCEDLPASLGREQLDSYTLAKWGVEYFKYDFCHNIPYSKYAPLVYGVAVSQPNSGTETKYLCSEATLEGTAKLMPNNKVEGGKYCSGLDANRGAMQYNHIIAESDGEYILTVLVKKLGKKYDKYLLIKVNDEFYGMTIPKQNIFNVTARFQILVKLNKGHNVIRLFNPIGSKADSAMLQYQLMGKCLIESADRYAQEKGVEAKRIVYSICEWGRNKPYKWGATAGNLWRTTPDIRPWWQWIKIIYEHNVKLYKYADVGNYNDPDMLEVGNGKLTYEQNISHFSLWCMMNAPLILGNDVRIMPDKVKAIVTNKYLISINQDSLCKQAKRIKKSAVDVLAKPLCDNKVAVCFFNKGRARKSTLTLSKLISDDYINLPTSAEYNVVDAWQNKEFCIKDALVTDTIPKNGCAVYIISKK